MDNILKLADHIETLPHKSEWTGGDGFTMNWVTYQCGAPACICGWAAHFAGAEWDLEGSAAEWLGIDWNWANDHLFYPGISIRYENVTPQRAAAALRRVAAAGDKYKELSIKDVWGLT